MAMFFVCLTESQILTTHAQGPVQTREHRFDCALAGMLAACIESKPSISQTLTGISEMMIKHMQFYRIFHDITFNIC